MTIEGVRVAVLDVGSNSVRLLVADVDDGRVVPVRSEREYVRLGVDAYELGRIGPKKLERTPKVARAFAKIGARSRERSAWRRSSPRRADRSRTPTSSSTRSSRSTGMPVVTLTAEEEGCLAWEGAIAAARRAARRRGSGRSSAADRASSRSAHRPSDPSGCESFDAGGLRVTQEHLSGDPPSAATVARARAGIAELLVTPTRAAASRRDARGRRRRVVRWHGSPDVRSAASGWRS